MDIMLLYNIDFNKAFVFDENRNLILDERTMNATKQFVFKWGFMIQLIIGEEVIRQEMYTRREMDFLYKMGNELKQRMENLRNMRF